MTQLVKHSNGRVVKRTSNGRFARITGKDMGIGGACPECRSFLLEHYDGSPDDRPRDPAKLRYRCFTCEPLQETQS